MQSARETQRYTGRFKIGVQDVDGELLLDALSAKLVLKSDHLVASPDDEELHGVLDDRTRVSLARWVRISGPNSQSVRGEEHWSLELMPHYVLFGAQHLSCNLPAVRAVRFTFDDAPAVFYDWGVFGHFFEGDVQPLVKSFVEKKAREYGRDHMTAVEVGAEIFYYTGKNQIVEAQTTLGRVTVGHSPRFSYGVQGFSAKTSIECEIVYQEPTSVIAAGGDILRLIQFFNLIAGRPQNVSDIRVLPDAVAGSEPSHNPYLRLHWSMPPRRDEDLAYDRPPQPGDMPVNGGMQPVKFSKIMTSWLARDSLWSEARARFSTASSYQKRYGIDRLVGAANMFDLLPESAVPSTVVLDEATEAARKAATELFKALPNSLEKQSALGAMGRMGTATLKHKVRHRQAIVSKAVAPRMDDLRIAADLAVDFRNHYVHGSPLKIKAEHREELAAFLTDTLEFIFAASDLIECGWDAGEWIASGSTGTHPFARYREMYEAYIQLIANDRRS